MHFQQDWKIAPRDQPLLMNAPAFLDSVTAIDRHRPGSHPRTIRPVRLHSWLNWHVKGTEGIYHKTSRWAFNVIITSNSLRNKFKTKCTAVINNYVPPKFTSTRYSQPLCNKSIKKYRRRIASRNTGEGRKELIRKPVERTDQQTGSVVTFNTASENEQKRKFTGYNGQV